MPNTQYPKYYRKDGRSVRRTGDTTGTEVRTPDNPKAKLPLSMSEVTYPDKSRFDDDVSRMEEVDQACYEDYVYAFLRSVRINIEIPMSELQLKRQLEMNKIIMKP